MCGRQTPGTIRHLIKKWELNSINIYKWCHSYFTSTCFFSPWLLLPRQLHGQYQSWACQLQLMAPPGCNESLFKLATGHKARSCLQMAMMCLSQQNSNIIQDMQIWLISQSLHPQRGQRLKAPRVIWMHQLLRSADIFNGSCQCFYITSVAL